MRGNDSPSRTRRAVKAVSCAAMLFGIPSTVLAATKSWNTGVTGGTWNVPGNWVPAGVPQAGDNVYLTAPDQNGHDAYLGSTVTPLLASVQLESELFFGAIALHVDTNGSALTTNYLTIGLNDLGTSYVVQSAGTVTVNNELYVAGADVEHTSSYLLNASGGTGWLTAGNEYIAYQSRDTYDDSQPAGQFIQGGGSNLANNLYVAYLHANDLSGVPSAGLYTMTAGTLLISSSQVVGYQGSGTFNQSGGYNECGSLSIGHQTGSIGAYTLSGSAQLVSDASMYVGHDGIGAFIQNGGEADVAAALYVAYNPNSAGQYTLNAGTLLNHGLIIGDDSGTNAAFSQAGGYNYVLSAANNLTLGTLSLGEFSPTSAGTYNLSGGTLLLGQTTYVGKVGAGTFHQTGGWHETITMFVGAGAAATGTYLLDNGTLLVHQSETIGQLGSGTFIQTGGMHTVGNTLYLPQPGASGYYGLHGGVLNASTILLTAGGTLDGAGFGATSSTTKLFQIGGTITGNLSSGGTFTYSSGSFSGRLANDGVVNLLADFAPGNGIDNEASLTLGGGRHITLLGEGMLNAGTFTLAADGSIGGADFYNTGTFIYNGGTFSGHLTDQGTLIFGSTFTAGGGLSVGSGATRKSLAAGQTFNLFGQGLDGVSFTVLAGILLTLRRRTSAVSSKVAG